MDRNDIIEKTIESIDLDNLGTMTYGGAIQDALEPFSLTELLNFCCKKLRMKSLVRDYLAGLITSHYISLERYKKEER